MLFVRNIKCYIRKKSYFFDIYVFDNLIVILCVYRVFSVGFWIRISDGGGG